MVCQCYFGTLQIKCGILLSREILRSLFYFLPALVYKWNHDKKYNDSLSEDSIEHVYVDRFEQFEDDNYFHEFLARYGRTL